MQALSRTNSKSLHGHWASLMAWHNSLAGPTPSVVDLMILDASPKVSPNPTCHMSRRWPTGCVVLERQL